MCANTIAERLDRGNGRVCVDLYIAVDEVDKGVVRIALFEEMPHLSCNFVLLAKGKKYDGTKIFKAKAGYYLQGGDIEFNCGVGGYSAFGPKIHEEKMLKGEFNKPFRVGMMTVGPHTVGSQFFITTAPTPWLENHYPVFGEVIDGEALILELEKLPTNSEHYLLSEVIVTRAVVVN